MPDDRRVNLDDPGDLGPVNNDLLKDVMEATQQAKKRASDDKIKDKQLQRKKTDRPVMYAIIAVAVVILLVIAYFVIWKGNESSARIPQNDHVRSAPSTGQSLGGPQGGIMSPVRPQQPYQSTQPPAPPRPPSDQPRPNPGDDYKQGGGGDGM